MKSREVAEFRFNERWPELGIRDSCPYRRKTVLRKKGQIVRGAHCRDRTGLLRSAYVIRAAWGSAPAPAFMAIDGRYTFGLLDEVPIHGVRRCASGCFSALRS